MFIIEKIMYKDTWFSWFLFFIKHQMVIFERAFKFMYSYVLYCDGSSRGNPGWSGYSVVVTSENGNSVIDKIISPVFRNDTSDRMELMALREALKWLKSHNFISAVIFSDSQMVVDGYNKHLSKWTGSGFLNVKHIEVWKDIAESKQKIGDKVYVEKIKAHQKRSNWNNEADRLAKVASSPSNPNKATSKT